MNSKQRRKQRKLRAGKLEAFKLRNKTLILRGSRPAPNGFKPKEEEQPNATKEHPLVDDTKQSSS